MKSYPLEFVSIENTLSNLESLISSLHKNRSWTIAINGKWGSGKTYLIDELIKRLEKEQENAKPNLVIKFNAWENVFFDDPLILILDAFRESLSEDKDSRIKSAMTSLISIMTHVGKYALKKTTSIDLDEIGELKDVLFKENNDITTKLQSYRSILRTTKETITKISEQYKIVFIVDDLDRCMPQYAMKILEQLHYMVNVTGMINILAIDHNQLEKSVNTIFGDKIDYSGYIQKYIDMSFEIPKITKKQIIESFFNTYCKRYHKSRTSRVEWRIINQMLADSNAREIHKINELLDIIDNQVEAPEGVILDLYNLTKFIVITLKLRSFNLYNYFNRTIKYERKLAINMDLLFNHDEVEKMTRESYRYYSRNDNITLKNLILTFQLEKIKSIDYDVKNTELHSNVRLLHYLGTYFCEGRKFKIEPFENDTSLHVGIFQKLKEKIDFVL
jgi:nucleoside-triphosphatase THEP1